MEKKEENKIPLATKLLIGTSVSNMLSDLHLPDPQLKGMPESEVYQKTKQKIDNRTFFRYFYLPFVISDVFFDYVDTVLDLSASMRISELKKASRHIKEIKKNYEYYKGRHLDFYRQRKENEHRDIMLDAFYEDFNKEYKMIRFKIANCKKDLLEKWRIFIGAVYMALIIFQVLREYGREADKVIESYWGECENSIVTRHAVETYELLWQYVGDCDVLTDSDMKASRDRILKSIKETELPFQ